jgi:hypothetical protein
MAVLLGALTWLDFRDGGIFLIPPFAATLTILIYQPNVSIAQPIAVVCGSLLGAAIGTPCLHHSCRFMRVLLDLRPPRKLLVGSRGTVDVGIRRLNSNLEDSGLRATKYSVIGAKLFASLMGPRR